VADRERTGAKMKSHLNRALNRLESSKAKKNVAVNDVEIVFTLNRGQVEDNNEVISDTIGS